MTSRSRVIDRLIRDLQLDLSQLWFGIAEVLICIIHTLLVEYKMIKPYWSINRICINVTIIFKSTCSRTICHSPSDSKSTSSGISRGRRQTTRVIFISACLAPK